MFEAELEYPYRLRVFLYALCHPAAVFWAKWVVLSAKPGAARFIRASPLLVFCLLIPRLFTYQDPEERSVAFHSFVTFMCIIPLRILSLCMNRGQAVKAQTSGLLAFSIAFLLPVNVDFDEKKLDLKKKTDSDSKEGKLSQPFEDVNFSVVACSGVHRIKETFKAFLTCVIKLPLIIVLSYVWKHWNLSLLLKLEAQVWWFFCFVSWIENFNEVLSLLLFGIKLSPSFDRPYLSASISEFWARRWNKVIQRILREMIYEPILQNRFIADRQYYYHGEVHIVRRIIGAMCVFSVSGLIHAWWLIKIMNVKTFPVLQFSFFAVNGIVLMIEKLIKHYVFSSPYLSSFVSKIPQVFFIISTHVILVTLGHFLFFPDLINSGFVDSLMDAVLSVVV